MSYKIIISKTALKDLKKIDKSTRARIAKKLQFYIKQGAPLDFARLLVHSSIGQYRLRVGHFRIAFDLDGDKINITRIQHRKDV